MRSKNTGARKALENVIHLVFLLCGIVAVGFVLVISVYLILSGLPAIRQIGLFRFLFGQVWDPTNTTTGAQYGILPFILTSIYGTAGARAPAASRSNSAPPMCFRPCSSARLHSVV